MNMLVIGLGKVGTSLALSVLAKGVDIKGFNKTPIEADVYPFDVFTEFESITVIPDIIFISVYDSAIEQVAKQVSMHFQDKLNGVPVIHSSGALGRDLLKSCEEYGAITAAAHPFQTFASISSKLMDGIPWGVDCKNTDKELFEKIINILGGSPIFLSEELKKNKALYHAIGVAASNYLVSAMQFAKELCAVAGLPHKELLTQICNTSIDNSLETLVDEFPLTGPLARTDQSTIDKHLAALSLYPDLSLIYSLLGESTQLLAKKRNIIPPDTELF